MPQFSTKRRVRHSAEKMSALGADTENYPKSGPLCEALRVKSRSEKGEGVTVLVADMTVAYKMVHYTFTSRVTLDRPDLKILVEYIDGPFRRLQNRWAFTPAGEQACDV